MDLLKVLIDKFKVKELIGIIWIASLITTVLPKNILEYLKIINIIEKYQVYISLALIISSAYYIMNLFMYVGEFLLELIINEKRIAIKYMKDSMSSDEMALLIQDFYDKNNNTFKSCGYINFTDGRKTPLVSNYVIYLSSNMSSTDVLSNGFCAFAYNLQPYTREFLNNNLRKNNIEIIGNSFNYRLI